jgi:hypothetical protein
MSTQHVRPTSGARVVVVASTFSHEHGKNAGRECSHCGSMWTVQVDVNGNAHVWRNGVASDSSILDWTGNNVAIECCETTGSVGGET